MIGPTTGIRAMSILQPDLLVSCSRRTETVSMGTMNGSRRMFSSGTSTARLIPAITTVAITYSNEYHQYSARRARPENVAYLAVRHVRTASVNDMLVTADP